MRKFIRIHNPPIDTNMKEVKIMRRKLVAIILAAVAIFAIATTALAGSKWSSGSFNGYYYELYDVCNSNSYRSSTGCETRSYRVYSDVEQYVFDTDGNERLLAVSWGSPAAGAYENSGSTAYNLNRIKCFHYINGARVGTQTAYAG